MEQQSGIYQIHNTITNHRYIGQSVHVKRRLREHFGLLRSGKCHNSHLQRAFDKYGETAFEASVLEWCDPDQLDEREIYYIQLYNSHAAGYNMTAGGSGMRDHLTTPVVLLNTGERFISIAAAHRSYPFAEPTTIAQCCTGRLARAGFSKELGWCVWAHEEDFDLMTPDEVDAKLLQGHNALGGTEASLLVTQKPVVLCNYGRHFKSVSDAGRSVNLSLTGIIQCCKKKSGTAGGDDVVGRYVWLYYEDWITFTADEIAALIQRNQQDRWAVGVVRLNDEKIYTNHADAAKESHTTKKAIVRVCTGKAITAGHDPSTYAGYRWMYLSDYEQLPETKRAQLREEANVVPPGLRAVVKVNTGEYFATIRAAAKMHSVSVYWIVACCDGRANVCGVDPNGIGYCWMYASEYSKLSEDEQQQLRVAVNSTRHLHAPTPICCVTTGVVYSSPTEASRATGADRHDIVRCCQGVRPFAGKIKDTGEQLVWQYEG